jgi:hypothetical protein
VLQIFKYFKKLQFKIQVRSVQMAVAQQWDASEKNTQVQVMLYEFGSCHPNSWA